MTIEQVDEAYYLKTDIVVRLGYLWQALQAIQAGDFAEAHVALYVGRFTECAPEEQPWL